MSIWDKPIFGKPRPTPTSTPASPAALRCWRMRKLRGAEVILPLVAGAYAGILLRPLSMDLFHLATTSSPGPSAPNLLAFVRSFMSVPAALWVPVPLVIAFVGGRCASWSAEPTREQLITMRHARRRSKWTIIAGLAAAVAAVVILAFAGFQEESLEFLAIGFGVHLTMAGCIIASLGLFARRGTRVVCAKCSYPMGSWRAAPDVCPECGARWRVPWKTRFGVRCIAWRQVALGAAMAAAGMVLIAA